MKNNQQKIKVLYKFAEKIIKNNGLDEMQWQHASFYECELKESGHE